MSDLGFQDFYLDGELEEEPKEEKKITSKPKKEKKGTLNAAKLPTYVFHGSYHYAGFGIRFRAFLIDYGIAILLGCFLHFIIFQLDLDDDPHLMYYPIIWSFDFFYKTLLESSVKQGTIGKAIFGLRVIYEDGRRLSFRQAVIRYFSTILSSLALGIGYLMIIFDQKKQALHDRVAKTYVVKS
ncbi:MAG: RDD family protein [Flammeovirgaceae bacterium]